MWLSNRGRWFYWITSFIQDYVDGSCDMFVHVQLALLNLPLPHVVNNG